MTTLVANNIENGNNVANNVNENNGYNAEVTNEVVVLNGDTFYKKNIVVGQKYRYGQHYFVIDKFEQRGAHLYYIGTLDKKPFENDLHALKVACECTERRAMNRSANDTENGKAVKVKRTTAETADSIERKYNSVRDLIKSAVAKLPENENITNALNGLLLEIELVRNGRVTAILDAEQAAHTARVERLLEIENELQTLQTLLTQYATAGNFEQAAAVGTQAATLQAEKAKLLVLEEPYRTITTPPTEDTTETATETQTDAQA